MGSPTDALDPPVWAQARTYAARRTGRLRPAPKELCEADCARRVWRNLRRYVCSKEAASKNERQSQQNPLCLHDHPAPREALEVTIGCVETFCVGSRCPIPASRDGTAGF